MNGLVSACLLGVKCKYNQGSNCSDKIADLLSEYHLIPVCPEIMGGLPTPRVPAEVCGGRVITEDGRDVTEQFRQGAWEALRLAKLYECRFAVLKEKSPSCGSGKIYDGTFTKTLTNGDGVTAKLLKEHGICVFGENTPGLLKALREKGKNNEF